MKSLTYMFFLLLPGSCQADVFMLKDGARLEGDVIGEMDGALLVKTRYGSLTITKADIQERQAALAPAAVSPDIMAEIPSAQPEAVAASTEVVTALPEPVVAPAPKLTFQTILPSTMTRRLIYMESGIAVATETFDAGGALVMSEGAIGNGTYTEYYPDGGLKTVKTMMSGKTNGTLRAFFPAGALQVEAYYLAGGKEGPFKYYTEDGKLLMEASYTNDLLNGWKKEYGADGAIISESYYLDDRLARPANPQAAPESAKESPTESLVTVKVTSLARGELFSFRLNGKYIGKVRLDKAFNLISQEGKAPDGEVKVYTEDGRLQKELVFEKNAIKLLRVYESGGPLKAEYSYIESKAVKQ